MSATGARIIVADNDRTVLELLQIRLELGGYRAFVTRDDAELMEMVRNTRPAAMLLDINIGGQGAKGVLEQLRRRKQLTFPVLAMGRHLTPEGLQELTALGARGCMIKPFSGTDVLERISWLIKPPSSVSNRPVHYVA